MTQQWTKYFEGKMTEILDECKRYVEIESPTHNKTAVDHMGEWVKQRFLELGCKVDSYEQPVYGNQLRVEYGSGEEQILILGHFDTVKEIGTLKNEPWRIEEGKAYGPGLYDMKSGIVFCYFALKTIIENQLPLNKRLVFFWNTDEEVGSPSSADLIQKEAKQSEVALVIEPAAKNGQLKTSRKGGGDFLLRVKGRAAHAGNDHQEGINAIEEIAHHVIKVQSWTDYAVGTTISVGTLKGGSVSNVVPEYAEAEIDVRVSTMEEAEKITARMSQLTAVLPGAQVTVEAGPMKPPMERTAQTEQLFLHAKQQAALEGFDLQETGVGGTSDGNFTAAVGTPTLDGLGPVGDGAHAVNEHILVERMPERIALLMRLFTTL